MFKRKPKVLTPEQMEEIRTKDFFDCILPGTIKFLSDHYIVGDSYRCVWAIREYPPSTEEQAILSQLNGALQAAARRSYRKEQRDLSKEGIASDIRVPYTSSGESALGAANAARQLAVAMLQDPEQVPYVRARLDMSTVLVPEMQRALEAIFRCVDEHLPLNQTSLQQMLDEAAFRQLAHGQAYNHDIRLQRQDIDMYLDRLRTAKPISEQVKDMSDGQLESYFANLGKKKGARPAETDE